MFLWEGNLDEDKRDTILIMCRDLDALRSRFSMLTCIDNQVAGENMNELLSSNVPDPSDFPPATISPGLRELDAALRCTICGEPFDAPVTLPCGHCFCSFVRPP